MIEPRATQRGTGGPPVMEDRASWLARTTGIPPVDSLADRRDALSSLTGWKPVLVCPAWAWTSQMKKK